MDSCTEEQVERTNGVEPCARTDAIAAVVSAVAGLAAAWIAAGSTGLLAHPLRRALTLLCLAVAILVQRPLRGIRPKAAMVLLPLALGLAVYMVTLPQPAVNVLAAAVVLAALAVLADEHRRDILLVSSTAVVAFGIYRFAVTSVPWLWLAADSVGSALGAVAGSIAGRRLRVGAAMGGLDFLVLTSVLWALYLPRTKPPHFSRAMYGLLAILAGHLTYLVALSYSPDLLAAFPLPTNSQPGHFLPWMHKAIPWNVPILACGIHLLIVAAMFRWSQRRHSASSSNPNVLPPIEKNGGCPLYSTEDIRSLESTLQRSDVDSESHWAVAPVALLVAVLLPFVAVFHPEPLRLEGRKIVFYEKGFLNWLKPTHGSYGRLSSGMYGMLPVLLESLGAQCLVSPDLSEADLEGADVLTLIFPDEPWQDGRIERIGRFVEQGGSLLVLGEHTTVDPNGNSRFNEILAPTAMRVRFDSATFAVGGWLQSYEAMTHPATVGIADDQNQFGVVIGASVDACLPARPLLIGRWGWADPGDPASSRAMMGNGRYDPGERLGDLVLAAEQPMEKGRIVALGDTSGLTNAISVSSYEFTSRLFAYLAGSVPAHAAWRQGLALLAVVFLIALVGRWPGPWKTTLVALGLTASLVACTLANEVRVDLLPDGRDRKPNDLAYIDVSHVEAYSSESWRPEGIGGFILTLMRNGYLALDLPELTLERLERAGLLASFSPTRAFSPAEVEMVKTFVNHGGTFILTAGYEQRIAAGPLLDAFGFRVGLPQSESLEPEPMGHFKSPYLESEGRRVYVRFHAAWPVACSDPNARVIAYGQDNRPVIIMREFGAGRVVLIGDPCFATNMNLEFENGQPFEGLRENADFWRWLFSMLRGEPLWIPPALQNEPNQEAGS